MKNTCIFTIHVEYTIHVQYTIHVRIQYMFEGGNLRSGAVAAVLAEEDAVVAERSSIYLSIYLYVYISCVHIYIYIYIYA